MLRGGWILRQTATRTRQQSPTVVGAIRTPGLIRSRQASLHSSITANPNANPSRQLLNGSSRIRSQARSISILPSDKDDDNNKKDDTTNKKDDTTTKLQPASILPDLKKKKSTDNDSKNETGKRPNRRKSKRQRRRPSSTLDAAAKKPTSDNKEKSKKTYTEEERAAFMEIKKNPTEEERAEFHKFKRSLTKGEKAAFFRERTLMKENAKNGQSATAAAAPPPETILVERELQDWYEDNHGVRFAEKCIVMKRVSGKFSTWKAQFTCPLTGESFECGVLKGLPEESIRQDEETNNEISYFKMANARRAVLARAMDCFLYRQDKSSANTRLCVEMPFEIGADMKPVVVEEPITEVIEEKEESDKESDNTDDEDSDADEDSDEDSDEYYYSDDDDDEEYTITYLPGTSPSGDNAQQGASNPMTRVIEGWSDTTLALQSEMESVPALMDKQPEKELAQLVKNASDWIEQELPSKHEEEGSAHRVMLQSTGFSRTLDIANSILKGLAKAHCRVIFQEKPRGVEEVATKIVDHLWTTMSAKPNADTYVAYLACLEGPDPASVAIRAKKILENMKNGAPVGTSNAEGQTYPKHTIGVVNAVIQLCAQMGGESGRFSLDEIENPNRDTFLSVLSCMSHPPAIDGEAGGFDPIFAQECIDEMLAAAEKNPADPSLSPDLQVYNAGLRWSGGVQSNLTRPYARPLPWDSHAEIFQNGFQVFDEDSRVVQEAYRMHAWLEEMSGLGGAITPNVETYEAVIQAYIRTGTQEGVKQAEVLLDSLLESSSYTQTLRMQTFHPIIAAWAYSGHEEGPAKVNKWISRLEALSEEAGRTIQVDSRVREAPLLAHARRMTTMLENKKDFSFIETEELIDTAHGCTVHLKDMCARLQDGSTGNQSNTLLDAQMFVLVLHTWGKLGLHFLKTNEGSDRVALALSKMYETVEEYEELTLSLHKKKSKDSNTEIQLQHMTGSAHKVYAAFLAILKDSIYLRKPTDSAWALDGQLCSIERWVRRIGEFGRKSTSEKEKEYSDDLLYSDMYSYVSAGSLPHGSSEIPSDFLVQIIKYLKDDIPDSLPPQRRGDLIRVLFLTMDLLSSQTDQSSLTSSFKEIVDTVCSLSNGPEEQEALLGRVLNRVEWMEEKKSSSPSSFAAVDYEAIVAEIRNHSSGARSSTRTARRTAGRQVTPRRKYRRRPGRPRSTSRSRKPSSSDSKESSCKMK